MALIGRMFKVWGFEKLGSAVTGVMMYLETFLCILIPMLLLGERLAPSTVIGGMIVLVGMYIVEPHKFSLHHRHHIWHSH